jgi:hypothetical protein
VVVDDKDTSLLPYALLAEAAVAVAVATIVVVAKVAMGRDRHCALGCATGCDAHEGDPSAANAKRTKRSS